MHMWLHNSVFLPVNHDAAKLLEMKFLSFQFLLLTYDPSYEWVDGKHLWIEKWQAKKWVHTHEVKLFCLRGKKFEELKSSFVSDAGRGIN